MSCVLWIPLVVLGAANAVFTMRLRRLLPVGWPATNTLLGGLVVQSALVGIAGVLWRPWESGRTDPGISLGAVFAFLLLLNSTIALRPALVLAPLFQPALGREEEGPLLYQLVTIINSNAVLGALALLSHFARWEYRWWLSLVAVLVWASAFHQAIRCARSVKGSGPTWGRSPYDPSPWWRRETYDCFLSYKSEDIDLVRVVADQLIASGVKVWFAEYLVLLEGREGFQDAIQRGIQRSRRGVVLSNPRYAQSKHCLQELDLLLQHCGANRILDVRLQRAPELEARYPMLQSLSRISPQPDAVEILEGIAAAAGFALHLEGLSTAAVPQPRSARYTDPQLGYSLDVADWERVDFDIRLDPGNFAGYFGRATFDGHETRWNLLVGTPAPGRRPIAMMGQVIDDRACFDQVLVVARDFVRRVHTRGHGVHLFFLDGYSHVVFTYWLSNSWTRRYSIVLPNPRTNENTEFAFTFSFFGPFREYCRHAHRMDRVVRSLQWE